MQIQMHKQAELAIAEVTGAGVLVQSEQDVLDLLGSFYPEVVEGVILHEENLPPEFFALRTRLAGQILQKFVQYRTKVAIVGDFDKYESKALADFIYECNKGSQIFFATGSEEAVSRIKSALK
jgi:hypothetical protein